MMAAPPVTSIGPFWRCEGLALRAANENLAKRLLEDVSNALNGFHGLECLEQPSTQSWAIEATPGVRNGPPSTPTLL